MCLPTFKKNKLETKQQNQVYSVTAEEWQLVVRELRWARGRSRRGERPFIGRRGKLWGGAWHKSAPEKNGDLKGQWCGHLAAVEGTGSVPSAGHCRCTRALPACLLSCDLELGILNTSSHTYTNMWNLKNIILSERSHTAKYIHAI